MSRWTHNICEACWYTRNPDRDPVLLSDPEQERCCYCAALNTDGIYVRDDPSKLGCDGNHGVS